MKTPKAIILKTNINVITSFVIVIENQSLNTVIPIPNITIIKINNAVLIPCDAYVFPVLLFFTLNISNGLHKFDKSINPVSPVNITQMLEYTSVCKFNL